MKVSRDKLFKILLGENENKELLKDLASFKAGDWISATTMRELYLRSEV